MSENDMLFLEQESYALSNLKEGIRLLKVLGVYNDTIREIVEEELAKYG